MFDLLPAAPDFFPARLLVPFAANPFTQLFHDSLQPDLVGVAKYMSITIPLSRYKAIYF
jgi:hypothetical protein